MVEPWSNRIRVLIRRGIKALSPSLSHVRVEQEGVHLQKRAGLTRTQSHRHPELRFPDANETQSTQHTKSSPKPFYQNEGNPKYKYTRSEKGENGNNHSIRLWELAGEDKIIDLTWRLRRQCTTKSKTPCRTLMMVNVYAMTDPIAFPTSSTIKRPRPQEQPRINSWAMALNVMTLKRNRSYNKYHSLLRAGDCAKCLAHITWF